MGQTIDRCIIIMDIEVMQGAFPHHVKTYLNHVKIIGHHFEWSRGVVYKHGCDFVRYYSKLIEEVAKKRYVENFKITECLKYLYCYLESKSNISNAVEWNQWPDVTYVDIYIYTQDHW